MPRFFIDNIAGEKAVIIGEDAVHIGRSLRMKPGESITLCDGKGTDYQCKITDITSDSVVCNILSSESSKSEPNVKITLYMALPKGDKMDLIIEKSTELGVCRIVPFVSKYCVSTPDEKSFAKKLARYSKKILSAAKQSGRGIIPEIVPLHSFKSAIEDMKNNDLSIIFYEKSHAPLKEILSTDYNSIGIMVGSEGGFSPEEVTFAIENNVIPATLGSRILRCETAPIAGISAILYETNNM